MDEEIVRMADTGVINHVAGDAKSQPADAAPDIHGALRSRRQPASITRKASSVSAMPRCKA